MKQLSPNYLLSLHSGWNMQPQGQGIWPGWRALLFFSHHSANRRKCLCQHVTYITLPNHEQLNYIQGKKSGSFCSLLMVLFNQVVDNEWFRIGFLQVTVMETQQTTSLHTPQYAQSLMWSCLWAFCLTKLYHIQRGFFITEN